MPINALDRKLLDRLVQKNLIEPEQFEAIVRKAERQRAPVSRVVWQMGLLDEKTIARHVARINGVDFLDLDSFEIDPAVLKYLRPSQARRYRAVPAGMVEGTMVFAVDDLSNILRVDELKALINVPVQVVLVTESALDRTIDAAYFGSGPRPSGDSNLLPAAISLSGIDTYSGEEVQAPAERGSEQSIPVTAIDSASEPNVLTEDFFDSSAVTRVVPVSSLTTQIEYESSDLLGEHAHSDNAERFHAAALTAVALDEPADDSSEPDAPIDPAELRELLRRMIDNALTTRAEEVEFNPPAQRSSRTRQRRDGAWSDAIDYPSRLHEPLISALRALARIPPAHSGPVESHFTMEGTRGRIPVIACFMPTLHGNRAVLRFPENVPILQKPFRVLGVGQTIERELDRRVTGSGGGVLLISADQSRLAQQLFVSILYDQVARRRAVTSVHFHIDRRIPRVHQMSCSDEAALERILAHVAVERPDLCGISQIPGAETLNRLFTMALSGHTFVGCLALPSPDALLAVMKSAGVDPMATAVGLIGHLYAAKLPRLCSNCRRPMINVPSDLPEWAGEINHSLLREAPGCHACGRTGRKGLNWVCQVSMPDLHGDGQLLTVRDMQQSMRELVIQGNLDPRDA